MRTNKQTIECRRDKQTVKCNQRANDYLMCALDVLGYQFHFTTKISWNFLSCMLFGLLVGLWRWHRDISIEIIWIMARSMYFEWLFSFFRFSVVVVVLLLLLLLSFALYFGQNSPCFVKMCVVNEKCDKGEFSWINTASKGTNIQNTNQCKCNVSGFPVSHWANRKRCHCVTHNLSS